MKQFFITGTDTDAGKTHVASLLLKLAVQHKRRAVGFKPVAAGAEQAFGQWVNSDALMLIESGNIGAKYDEVNPVVFAPAIAPHIAAAQAKQVVKPAMLSQHYQQLKQHQPDLLISEGAGGWAVPLSEHAFLYDWVKAEKLPVIMVVGMKLGCINHALLTAAHIQSQGVECVGWVANQLEKDMPAYQENLATLTELLAKQFTVPLLAEAPYTESKPKLRIHKPLLGLLGLN